MAASPFSSSLPHYHSYYPGTFVFCLCYQFIRFKFTPEGTHDHELKRQYLSLLPPKQIIEICLTFDSYVPPYAKTTIWPLDLNAAIAGLQKIASKSLSETSKRVTDNTTPPEAHDAESHVSSPTTTDAPNAPNPTSAPAYPQTPFGYPHSQVAYPHAPYYASGYPYPYSYSPPVQNGLQPPPLTPSAYGTVLPHLPEPSGGDDLPSYEEMIVEALTECTDPEGWVPKDLFSWMAARYPLQSNFRPSASQALQKAYKRGRFEKNTNGKYRLSASWEGGSVSLFKSFPCFSFNKGGFADISSDDSTPADSKPFSKWYCQSNSYTSIHACTSRAPSAPFSHGASSSSFRSASLPLRISWVWLYPPAPYINVQRAWDSAFFH